MIEIYDGDTIHYMAPLCKQDEFYVPEAESEFSDLLEPEPPSPNSTLDGSTDCSMTSSRLDDEDSLTSLEHISDSRGNRVHDKEGKDSGSDETKPPQTVGGPAAAGDGISQASPEAPPAETPMGRGDDEASSKVSDLASGTHPGSNTTTPGTDGGLKHRRIIRAQSESAAVASHQSVIHRPKAQTPKV